MLADLYYNNIIIALIYAILHNLLQKKALQQNQGITIIRSPHHFMHKLIICAVAELEAIKAKKLSHLGHLEVCICAL